MKLIKRVFKHLVLATLLFYGGIIFLVFVGMANVPPFLHVPIVFLLKILSSGQNLIRALEDHFLIRDGINIIQTPMSKAIAPWKARIGILWCFLLISALSFFWRWIAKKYGTRLAFNLKMGSSLLAIIFFGFLIFLVEMPPTVVTNFASQKSIYIGKKIKLQKPFVYLANLPKGYRSNSYAVHVADFELTELLNHCGNCIDDRRLETPIRVIYISEGTEMTVLDSFDVERHKLGYNTDTPIKFLLLKDNLNRVSEIMEISFRTDFLRENAFLVGAEERSIIDKVSAIKAHGYGEFAFCGATSSGDNIQKFIRDFALDTEMRINAKIKTVGSEKRKDSASCSKLYFSSAEAFLTAHYFFEEWNIYGNWLD